MYLPNLGPAGMTRLSSRLGELLTLGDASRFLAVGLKKIEVKSQTMGNLGNFCKLKFTVASFKE